MTALSPLVELPGTLSRKTASFAIPQRKKSSKDLGEASGVLIPPASSQVRAHCAQLCMVTCRVDMGQKRGSVQVFYMANPMNASRVRHALPQPLLWRGWMRSGEGQGSTSWQIPLAGGERFGAGQPFLALRQHLLHTKLQCGGI